MTALSRWQRLTQQIETQRRSAAHMRRMAPGSLGGRTEVASPAPPRAAASVLAPEPSLAPAGAAARSLFRSGGPTGQTPIPHNTVIGLDGWQVETHNDAGLTIVSEGVSLPPGQYMVWAEIEVAASGVTWGFLTTPGDTAAPAYFIPAQNAPSAGVEMTHTVPNFISYPAGGEVGVSVRQTSGAAVNLDCYLWIVRF